ncbi:hypothetical protein C8R44DRAFT_746333 [Mycena epipterygia]|nr:hypothetical protein C8R44DRAFT_746333 [Mycena epipterygia]
MYSTQMVALQVISPKQLFGDKINIKKTIRIQSTLGLPKIDQCQYETGNELILALKVQFALELNLSQRGGVPVGERLRREVEKGAHKYVCDSSRLREGRGERDEVEETRDGTTVLCGCAGGRPSRPIGALARQVKAAGKSGSGGDGHGKGRSVRQGHQGSRVRVSQALEQEIAARIGGFTANIRDYIARIGNQRAE